jgi:pimeloyl-ACP methyl ester carboxylesterase
MSDSAHSPTIVLVHGAFADASSWKGVVERLQAKGIPVTAPANPLRGIAFDSAYTASLLVQMPRRRRRRRTSSASSSPLPSRPAAVASVPVGA